MKLAFPIRFYPDGDAVSAQGMAPYDGIITYGMTAEEARFNAVEALTGYLQVLLEHGDPIPVPQVVEAPDVEMIVPDPTVTVPLQLRWAREEANLTQGELATRLGVSYQSVQRLERSGANPSIKTLVKVARALGRNLTVAI
ncbi:MAG: type II toxin-antitoxin system HicB family antitoxin [Candidatus Sericytochromatia bacterium]|nr:type II toxin-antitoxin system HicB family antitoxin [Candidatus Sericytochromatia bacterium]